MDLYTGAKQEGGGGRVRGCLNHIVSKKKCVCGGGGGGKDRNEIMKKIEHETKRMRERKNVTDEGRGRG